MMMVVMMMMMMMMMMLILVDNDILVDVNTSTKKTLPYLITIQVFDSICPNFPSTPRICFINIFSNKFTPEERREILEKDL